MIRGRKPKPLSGAGPKPPKALPRCPDHLSEDARKEWRRLATPLHQMGVLTICDRAALAAYCQAWARWVEAERKLAETPLLLKTPSGYVQQSPWLTVANKQLELMGRYMAELGLTPSSRTRIAVNGSDGDDNPRIVCITRYANQDEHEDRPGESASATTIGAGECEDADARPGSRKSPLPCRP